MVDGRTYGGSSNHSWWPQAVGALENASLDSVYINGYYSVLLLLLK